MTKPALYQEILYEVDGPSAIITLNRPAVLNAMTNNMLIELKHALATAEADETVLGIILTGAGRGFCAGMDMNALDSQASGGDLSAGKAQRDLKANPGDTSMGPNFQLAFTYILSIRKPIIAAVNGACAGLGMSIACLCDLRFLSEKSKFVTAFAQRGLVAEHGQSWILPRLLGSAKALDLLWSSRKVTADEALSLGLGDRVFSAETLLTEAKLYIEKLAESCAPVSLMLIKQQVYKHLNTTLGEAMIETNEMMAKSLEQDDFKEGVKSYIEKRSPNFDKIKI